MKTEIEKIFWEEVNRDNDRLSTIKKISEFAKISLYEAGQKVDYYEELYNWGFVRQTPEEISTYYTFCSYVDGDYFCDKDIAIQENIPYSTDKKALSLPLGWTRNADGYLFCPKHSG